MNFPKSRLTTLASMAFVSLAILSCAKNESTDDKAYVGIYNKSEVDSLSQIVLLEDHTFCYAFMGGALDFFAAGHWQSAKGKPGITLHEVRANSVLFPVLAEQSEQQDGMIRFGFDGYSLSEAYAPVFATAADDAQPKVFQPLFDEDMNSWAESYSLPPVDKTEAAYFYLGQVEEDKAGSQRLHVFQYQVGDGVNIIRIGFDNRQATPKLSLSANLTADNLLEVDGQAFGEKKPLTEDILRDVKEGCINPVLAAKVTDENKNKNFIEPVKDFYVDMDAVAGEPIFKPE